MSNHISSEDLQGTWLHSFEEEAEPDRPVFRPGDYAFRPARRPRTGFTLSEDGTVRIHQSGPDDRSVQSPGTWNLDGDTLTISGAVWAGTYRVESVEGDVLVLRRLEEETRDGQEN